MKKYMRHILFCLSLIILGLTPIKAQNFSVTGTVINAETGAAVEFANIGVEGTYLGTASDLNGNFEIILSQAIIDKFVSVSAVGYKAKRFSVKDWEGQEGLIIQLAPTNYGISEVNVAAKSKVGYGIIKTASNLISENYTSKPFTLSAYFLNSKSGVKKEALVKISDNKGYGERSFTESFQNRNFKIVQNNVTKEALLLKDGLTLTEELINADIVRSPGNILSIETINEFDVNEEDDEVIDGEKVWVISYKCKNPSIQNTGDAECIAYSGTIFIAQDNNAIIKNTIKVVRQGKFRHGVNFSNPEETKEELKYDIETSYKLNEGKYIIHSIKLNQEYKGVKEAAWLKVVDILPLDKSITSRQYFNNTKKDADFWNSFKRP
ncbi:carboxypeptidase-like regulatory domain-containing protein [Labilibacter marinus]|uniref:carboxypeptidase-like regulatory domain-containing protein n=1 Tax=Labilibacter marinus TaxID=1477105 RepID=UPI00083564EA|nr:carboxypeptidase-like regulatory domain-containing protein [Labilibacter marinus]